MAVKRYKVSNRLLITGKDAPADLDLRNVYVVLADDYDAAQARIRELKKALRDLLEEVEQVVSSRSIPPTWLDEEQPDSAIVNARILVEQK